MTAPRLATIISSAIASALAFYVITRSGLAGTLAGAAVASAVINATSHWAGQGLEQGTEWVRRRRTESEGEDVTEVGVSLATQGPSGGRAVSAHAIPEAGAPRVDDPSGDSRATDPRSWWLSRRGLTVWVPVVLAVLALSASTYAIVTGEPVERVVLRERVVEKPTVETRVIRETVTVTVPAPAAGPDQAVSPNTTVPATTSTTAPPGVVGGGSGTATPPRTTATTATTTPPQTTTTSAPTAPGP